MPSNNDAVKNVIQGDLKSRQRQKEDLHGIAIFGFSLINYLCDSGASKTIISEEVFKKIKADDPKVKLKSYRGRGLRSANKPLEILGTIQLRTCTFAHDVVLKDKTAIVAKDLAGNLCLLGRDWQRSIPGLSQALGDLATTVQNMSQSVRQMFGTKCKPTKITAAKLKENEILVINTGLLPNSSEEEEEQLLNSREEIQTIFEECSASSLVDLVPQANREHAFQIRLRDSSQEPITCKSRPLPFHVKDKVKEAIQEQIDAGIIKPSRSAWASALRVVHKPDFSIRITVDYKPLNKIIIVDQYPIPAVKELFSKMSESSYFSKIDMKAAYHQIPMHPNSIQYTAFICEFGQFEYLCKPMGIANAPACFQRFMDYTLREFITMSVLNVYLDDIIIFTTFLDDHVQIAKRVLDLL